MVINTDTLSQIPLEERLIFKLGEMFTHQILHQSVVDAIKKTEPKGLKFTKLADFNIGSTF